MSLHYLSASPPVLSVFATAVCRRYVITQVLSNNQVGLGYCCDLLVGQQRFYSAVEIQRKWTRNFIGRNSLLNIRKPEQWCLIGSWQNDQLRRNKNKKQSIRTPARSEKWRRWRRWWKRSTVYFSPVSYHVIEKQVRKVLWTRKGVRATVVTAGHFTHAELTSRHALASRCSCCVHSRVFAN